MSQSSVPSDSTGELQFDRIEHADANSPEAIAQDCKICNEPIQGTYYAIANHVLCPPCRELITAPPKGTGLGRFLKATFLGLGAGLIGALIWFLVRRVAHLEAGLVALLVGFLVGKAVRIGSADRGGRAYQILAVVLTYSCIAANYMPDIIELIIAEAQQQNVAGAEAPVAAAANDAAENVETDAPVGAEPPMSGLQAVVGATIFFVLVFGLCLAAPFFGGAQSILGLLIIGFALIEAWKLSARRELPISGPYEMAPRPAV